MNKTELWAEVQKALEAHKASDILVNELSQLLAPKASGATGMPPKLNKKGEITHVYCQWHKDYEPIEEFAKSTKTKTGVHYECKVAGKEWQEYGKRIKFYENETKNLLDKILDGEISQDGAKEIADNYKVLIAELKEARANKINIADFDAAK